MSLRPKITKRVHLFIEPPSHNSGDTLHTNTFSPSGSKQVKSSEFFSGQRYSSTSEKSPWKKQKFYLKEGRLVSRHDVDSAPGDIPMVVEASTSDEDIDSVLLQQSIHTYLDLTFLNSEPQDSNSLGDGKLVNDASSIPLDDRQVRSQHDSITAKKNIRTVDSNPGAQVRSDALAQDNCYSFSMFSESVGLQLESNTSQCLSLGLVSTQTQFEMVELSSQKLLAKYGLVTDNTQTVDSVEECTVLSLDDSPSGRRGYCDKEKDDECIIGGEESHERKETGNSIQQESRGRTGQPEEKYEPWREENRDFEFINYKTIDQMQDKVTPREERNSSTALPARTTCQDDVFPRDVTLIKAGQRLTITALADCHRRKAYYNICVAVLQVLPFKEVLIKTGMNAGSYVPLASLQVGDSTKEYMKLTLWRKLAGLVEHVSPGDIIVFTDVSVDVWREEYFCQTTYKTRIIHSTHQELMTTAINKDRYSKLVDWLKEHHPYLSSTKQLQRSRHQIQPCVSFVPISDLQADTIVNIKAKVVRIVTLTEPSAFYKYQGKELNKTVIVLEDEHTVKNHTVDLTLWGSASHWKGNLEKNIGRMFRFCLLQVRYSPWKGCVELHTTPNSRLEVCNFLDNVQDNNTSEILHSTLQQIIISRYTGLAQVNVNVKSIRLTTSDMSSTPIDEFTDIEDMVQMVKRTQFVGCKKCHAELTQDDNGIFAMCSRCVPICNSTESSLGQCFRTMFFSLSQDNYSTECEVSPSCIANVLLGTESNKLISSVNCDPAISEKYGLAGRLAECCLHLLRPTTRIQCILHCYTRVDENSVAMERTFHLHGIVGVTVA